MSRGDASTHIALSNHHADSMASWPPAIPHEGNEKRP